jgi:hypothetical protein
MAEVVLLPASVGATLAMVSARASATASRFMLALLSCRYPPI